MLQSYYGARLNAKRPHTPYAGEFCGNPNSAILALMEIKEAHDYLNELAKRAKQSRAYKRHQAVGLEVAEMLHDRKHKALYIKLAKEGNPDAFLELAKTVAEKNHIKNHGAYFMRLLTNMRKKNR